MTKKKKLSSKVKFPSPLYVDVGCGPHKKEGYLGLDLIAQPGVDIVADVEKDGLPFSDGTVDKIYMSHFLEHVNDPAKMLNEVNRVLKDGGEVTIIVPHYSNPYAYHFTHKSFWSYYAFEPEYLDYYLQNGLVLKSRKLRIVLLPGLDTLFNWFANQFPGIYERLFSGILKAWEVQFVLEKNAHKKTYTTLH